MTREKDILRNRFNGTISYILIFHAYISNRRSHHLLELGHAWTLTSSSSSRNRLSKMSVSKTRPQSRMRQGMTEKKESLQKSIVKESSNNKKEQKDTYHLIGYLERASDELDMAACCLYIWEHPLPRHRHERALL